MAIQITLDRVLEEQGMTLTDLSDRIGVTLANLSILKTNKAKAIRFSTLEALCRELQCQPGDLLAYSGQPGKSAGTMPPNKRLQPTARPLRSVARRG